LLGGKIIETQCSIRAKNINKYGDRLKSNANQDNNAGFSWRTILAKARINPATMQSPLHKTSSRPRCPAEPNKYPKSIAATDNSAQIAMRRLVVCVVLILPPNDQAQRPPPETPGRLQQSRTNYLNRPTAQRGGGSLQRPC